MAKTRKSRGVQATETGRQKLLQAKASRRNEKGKPWTYSDVATAAQVDEKTVQRFFYGQPKDREYAIAIVQALGLNITEVVDPNEWNSVTQTSASVPESVANNTPIQPTPYENLSRKGIQAEQFKGRDRELTDLHYLLQQKRKDNILIDYRVAIPTTAIRTTLGTIYCEQKRYSQALSVSEQALEELNQVVKKINILLESCSIIPSIDYSIHYNKILERKATN